MLSSLAPLLIPVPLTLAIYFQELTYSSKAVRLSSVTATAAIATLPITDPQWENPLLRYVIGLYSCWFVIWSVNILFAGRPSEYKRVQKQHLQTGAENSDEYFWQSMPKVLTWARVCWSLDLATNFRAVGWSHGGNLASARADHPERKGGDRLGSARQSRLNQPGARLEGDHEPSSWRSHVWRLLWAYFWFDTYQNVISPLCNSLLAPDSQIDSLDLGIPSFEAILIVVRLVQIAGSGLGLYCLFDGFHALVSLVSGACGFGPGEAWMYPPLFGSVKFFFPLKLQDVFGKFWNNHFKHGLTLLSRRIVPRSPHPALTGILRALTTFTFAAAVHGAAHYAVLQSTRSLTPVFLFDIIQPFCIALQMIISGSVSKYLSLTLGRVADLAIGLAWFYWVVPLRLEDEAVLRALGGVQVPWSVWEFFSQGSIIDQI